MKNLFLILFAAGLTVVPFVGKAQIVDETLVLYLPLDGTEKDLSQYGNDGVLIGSAKWIDGRFGKGVELPAIEDGIEIQHSDSLNWGDGPVTLEFWIKPYKGFNGGLDKGTGTCYILGAHGLQLRLGKSGTGTLLQSKSELAVNEWSHIAAIKDEGEMEIYINGELDAEGQTGEVTVNNEQSLFIGNRPQFAEGIEGIVDEIRIWRRALSEDEIRRYMEMGKEQFIAVNPKAKLTETWGSIKTISPENWRLW
jgi:hypothetical protein